jgi:hypothetical protein
LMAGSKARGQIWPDVARWLGERSDERRVPVPQWQPASAPADVPKAA